MKRTLKYLYAVRDKLRETVIVDPKEIADKLVFFHDKNGLIHFPMGTDGRVPVRNIPLESDLIAYKRKCTNDGSNAGNQSIKLEPAVDSIVTLYLASILNLDTVTIAAQIAYSTAGALRVCNLSYDAAVAVGGNIVYPRGVGDADELGVMIPIILTDAFEIALYALSIAVSQDANFHLLYSFIGDAPTITETGPTGAVWSDIS